MYICIWESINKCASLFCLQDPSKLRKREIVSSFLTEILLALKEVTETVYYTLHFIIKYQCSQEETFYNAQVACCQFVIFVSYSLWNTIHNYGFLLLHKAVLLFYWNKNRSKWVFLFRVEFRYLFTLDLTAYIDQVLKCRRAASDCTYVVQESQMWD